MLGSDRPDLANSFKCHSLNSNIFEAELGVSEAALPVLMSAPDDLQSGPERCVGQVVSVVAFLTLTTASCSSWPSVLVTQCHRCANACGFNCAWSAGARHLTSRKVSEAQRAQNQVRDRLVGFQTQVFVLPQAADLCLKLLTCAL